MGEWAPEWDLLVNNQPIPSEYKALINSVAVDATVDGADELIIQAVGWSSIDNEFRILGETIFGMGNFVTVRMGYHPPDGTVETLQRFELVREEGNYPNGGVPSVVIRGYSAEHRLVEYTRARKFQPNDTITDVVKAIAEEHGLNTSRVETVPKTLTKGAVKPKGTTDWKYLKQLAYLAGFGPPYVRYDENLDADVLYFEKTALDKQSVNYVFTYNVFLAGSTAPSGNLISFNPELSLSGVPTKVEVTGFDPESQDFIVVKVEITAGGQQTTVQTEPLAESSAYKKYVEKMVQGSQVKASALDAQPIPRPNVADLVESIFLPNIKTQEDALLFAERWIETRNEAFMVARAEVQGTSGVWVGQIHEFNGLSSHHEGLWEVVGCSHRMDDRGYRCSLELNRIIVEEAQKPTEV